MTGWTLGLALVALAACGRVAFDPLPDGDVSADGNSDGSSDAGYDGMINDATPDAPAVRDLSCNTPVSLGPLPPITNDGSPAGYLSAVATPRGVLVAFSAMGLQAMEIDLTVDPPQRGPTIPLGITLTQNLTITVSDDRRYFSTGSTMDVMQLDVRDEALGGVTARSEPAVAAHTPDHSSRRIGGGITVMGAQGGRLQAATFDAGGALGASEDIAVANVTSPSITTLDDGSYVIVHGIGNNQSAVVRLAADLTFGMEVTVPIPVCRYANISAIAGTTSVGIVCICLAFDSCTMGTVFDYEAGTFTAPQQLVARAQAPMRSNANSAGLWTFFPTAIATGAVRLLAADGTLGPTMNVGPIPDLPTTWGYEVIARDDDRAYALWIDEIAAPTLFIMQLCAN